MQPYARSRVFRGEIVHTCMGSSSLVQLVLSQIVLFFYRLVPILDQPFVRNVLALDHERGDETTQAQRRRVFVYAIC